MDDIYLNMIFKIIKKKTKGTSGCEGDLGGLWKPPLYMFMVTGMGRA